MIRTGANPRARFFALGRLPAGRMNKTEARYSAVLEAQKSSGHVLWYRFEGLKLRLANNTFLTVDFAVLMENRELHMVDVKGSAAVFQDDAKAKMKIAAEMYPFRFFVAMPRRVRDGGGFDLTEVAA